MTDWKHIQKMVETGKAQVVLDSDLELVRKKVQADLIAKLKEKLKPIIHDWQSTEGSRVYDGSHGNTDDQEEQLNEMIKELASECLGNGICRREHTGSASRTASTSRTNPKPEKLVKISMDGKPRTGMSETIKVAWGRAYPHQTKPTYCKGCSFKCQASDCDCTCHDAMRKAERRPKK